MTASNSVYDLSGRVAVITGAARGIGARIAQHLAGLGALPILADRPGTVQSTAREIAAEGANTDWIEFDVTDSTAVEAAAAEVVRRHGYWSARTARAGQSSVG